MTFKKWLSQYSGQDNRAGDLYTLISNSETYPVKAKSYQSVMKFISSLPVDENTDRLKAAITEAWEAYDSSNV